MKSMQNSNPSINPRRSFVEWYHSSTLGKLLQQSEASYLLDSIQLTYNQKILQVGRLGSENRYIIEDFRNNYTLIDDGGTLAGNAWSRIIARADELPVASESIDLLILPHLVEFEDNPQPVLKEAERILKPEGTAYLLVFNPWSLRSVVSRFPRGEDFLAKNSIACYRLIDWLRLLKFEAEFSAGFGLASSLTIFKPDSLLTKSMAQLASAYAVKAIKRTYMRIPVKPAWLSAPSLLPGHIVETPSPLMRR
jgi:SAM-dependent methyltransferase